MKKQLHKLSVEDAFEGVEDEDFTLYHLDQYFKTSDANWFINGFTGRETKLDKSELTGIELKITEEYFRATNDRGLQNKVGIMARMNALSTKHQVVYLLLERVSKGFSPEQQETRALFIQELKKWGFKMEIMATPEEDIIAINEIASQVEGIKTQIEILSAKIKKNADKDSLSLDSFLLVMAKALELGYPIRKKETPVIMWLAMCQRLEEIAAKN